MLLTYGVDIELLWNIYCILRYSSTAVCLQDNGSSDYDIVNCD